MPIFSYIAIPKENAVDSLYTELSALKYCQVIPAENQDILVLVTDTPNETIEKNLQGTLKKLQYLQSLSLTFGYDEKE